jgi:CRP-like cAMP-binding protein
MLRARRLTTASSSGRKSSSRRARHQGHRPAVVRLIASGFVKTVRLEHEDDALIAIRGEGWMLGLSPALLDRSYATSGFAATRCGLRSLSLAAFKQSLRRSPAFGARALDLLARQVRADDILRGEMAVCRAAERLQRSLVRMATLLASPRRRGHVELALPITHREFAQHIGVSQEHLSRLLSELERNDALRRRHGVLLLPPARWRQLAERCPRVVD